MSNASADRQTSQVDLSRFRVAIAELRWRCQRSDFDADSTLQIEPATGVVGQDTAVEALRFGLDISGPGQNIFVRGLTGTGRLTLVRRVLEGMTLECPLTKDRCYVHNFSQPERPRLITLPPKRGQDFRRRIDRLIEFIRNDLPTALSSEGINARRRNIEQTTQESLKELVSPLESQLQEAGFTMVSLGAGPVSQTAIFPVIDDRAVAPEEFEQMHARGEIADALYKEKRDLNVKFEPMLADLGSKVNKLRAEHEEAIERILADSASAILKDIVGGIKENFNQQEVATFLDEVVDDIVQDRLGSLGEDHEFTRLYRVNVVTEQHGDSACPIITENVPTLRNLIGAVDFDYESTEEARPTHMGIRAGSLLRADGGFLIIEAREILEEPDAWKVLKRTVRSGKLEVIPADNVFPGSAPMIKPEAIDVVVKIVMIGSPETYYALDSFDPEFPHLFKVLADFDDLIPRNEAGIKHYAAVISRFARDEKLLPFEWTAIAALVEQGARIAAMKDKLSARFGRVADIARESALRASQRNADAVTGSDVMQAIQHAKNRADLPARRFREFIKDGTIRVLTKGAVVGQLNGLAVIQAGPMVYGFPTRITATIGPGAAGVINIDREAALSGAIHTKGFYILGGLLRGLLRTGHPLAFEASVAFEQSYGAIDGDSASGAEICCLLSALTNIPLRQDVAMTGAIDQQGNILSVGAINEKIEGFFDICQDAGMTGTQGVIIPKTNVGDLMLRHDVTEACEAGKFSVYSVSSIPQALEILANMEAGQRDSQGLFPKGSLLHIAVERATDYWRDASSPADKAQPATPA